MTQHLMIGIDPGVQTGVAVWCTRERKLVMLGTSGIVEAMQQAALLHTQGLLKELRFEDARMIGGIAGAGRERLQGAGSVKRDCSVWAEWCAKHGIKARPISPRAKGAKLSAEQFARICKFEGRTSQHARDAAMLVIGA